MFYAIAIVVLILAAYWIWGMRKMVRMNYDSDQYALTRLLVRAGAGDDEGLLTFISERQWTNLQIGDRVAHSLTLAEKLYSPDEYARARTYANASQGRYRSEPNRSPNSERGWEAKESSQAVAPRSIMPSLAIPAEETARVEEPKQPIRQRYGFRVNEFVIYPAHGVGQILAIEDQEIAGAKLELFVINFVKDKMTLRVPAKKVANVGMRKISDPPAIQEVYRTLSKPPHVAEGNWSRLAQEYEAKIHSGDIISTAEVMRDLYRPAVDAGQSYSERQLYAVALDRLAREVAVVQDITEEEAVKELESLVIARRRA
jgi:RNA polymerase-interacting CarD/CdnL/TRCF family regulator